MKKHSLSVALVASLAMLLTAGLAAAHDASYPTTIGSRHVEGGPGGAVFSGRLQSERVACTQRRVNLIVEKSDGSRAVLDSTGTSENGAYGLYGEFSAKSEMFVRAPRKTITGSGHSHICKAVEVQEYPQP